MVDTEEIDATDVYLSTLYTLAVGEEFLRKGVIELEVPQLKERAIAKEYRVVTVVIAIAHRAETRELGIRMAAGPTVLIVIVGDRGIAH